MNEASYLRYLLERYLHKAAGEPDGAQRARLLEFAHRCRELLLQRQAGCAGLDWPHRASIG